MTLEELIIKVRRNPALEEVWKKAAVAALNWCASSDEAALNKKAIPPTEEFDQAWNRLLKEAAGQGIVFEEKVFPHDITRIIAR